MSKGTVSTALYRDHHANVGQLVGRIEALLASRTMEADPAALILEGTIKCNLGSLTSLGNRPNLEP